MLISLVKALAPAKLPVLNYVLARSPSPLHSFWNCSQLLFYDDALSFAVAAPFLLRTVNTQKV